MHQFDILSTPKGPVAKGTWVGGLLTLLSVGLVLGLVIVEARDFRKPILTKNLVVENNPSGDTVSVRLNIKLPNAPCAILSLDVEDESPHHAVDIPTRKFRIDGRGQAIGPVA